VKVERRIPALVALLALVVASVPAGAHDHNPPKVTLKTSKGSQAGALWEAHWAHGSDGPFGRTCFAFAALGSAGFPPEPLGMALVEEASFVLAKKQKPTVVALEAWAADPTVILPAPRQDVDHKLERFTTKSGERRWRVLFTPPFLVDDYLHLHLEWKDVDGCGEQSMDLGYWLRLSA